MGYFVVAVKHGYQLQRALKMYMPLQIRHAIKTAIDFASFDITGLQRSDGSKYIVPILTCLKSTFKDRSILCARAKMMIHNPVFR